jgi:hypothetical protein
MTGDRLVERGASLLEDLSQRARAQGGFVSRLAPDLADDAVFLRKLKPSLVKARIRGEHPTNGRVQSRVELPPAPPKRRKKSRGPNPFVVAGAALVAGVFVAKFVDWRGHAHPRD